MKIKIYRWQISLSKIDKICPLTIPNQISTISMHTPSLVKSIDIYSNYRPATKIWMDGRLTGRWQMDGHTDSQCNTITPFHTIDKKKFLFHRSKQGALAMFFLIYMYIFIILYPKLVGDIKVMHVFSFFYSLKLDLKSFEAFPNINALLSRNTSTFTLLGHKGNTAFYGI